jgi:hypothetical protein
MNQQEVKDAVEKLSAADRKLFLNEIRKIQPIHSLEKEWNITAEFVLEAISKSQDITKRGVRGIIAELAFSEYVLKNLDPKWVETTDLGPDLAYDSELINGDDKIHIQTKNQRLSGSNPMRPGKTLIKFNPELADWFIAETQKTRSGKKKKSKDDTDPNADIEEILTRPYRFGEFHILSVCMQPSHATKSWESFMFCPARGLTASPKDPAIIATMQPVPPSPLFCWTNKLDQCIEWVLHPETMPAPFVPKPKMKAVSKKKVAQSGSQFE